jgi:hypothetical protein
MSAYMLPEFQSAVVIAANGMTITPPANLPKGTGNFNWWLYLLMIGLFIILVLISIWYERAQKIKADRASDAVYQSVEESGSGNGNMIPKSQGV